VGYEEGGYLTESVRRRPYSVILLDEIEKAHAEVFNVLLQVLDDGRLTDGQGRTVDFRNTIIVMTSNLGSHVIQEMSGEERYDEMKSAVMEIVGEHFRPEFVNRVDDIIVFHPLEREQIRKIAELQIGIIADRLEDSGMTLDVTSEAAEFLANVGYDNVYGARPLKRAIQRYLENPLARQLLSESFRSGDTIVVEPSEGKLVFVSGRKEKETTARS
jgi:ATP-dependent Clp protease ATP-binding subunit ClpB